ncbi:hypothetical protein TBLA_0C03170 [Henningerozyma blattae CBS 6284]|uniref:37S ribosomal protein S22 n=1 Tax=Henningerozyma blattae (strain ATCC 34711 / CBS 6284 / DSM 70876 / NBRC 10599 / NRRL Y-10934 / UCD 77-7) TaxID=1071380 RepID=I2H169_HENB6|nr:hypothetical protein TBLA_0C03170 [Tetrapisispora blattae CBS 6284]CCH60121.1 hypothetical protein TBLA_0C03170 [Tetrapisispora blattae CBS 6284]
MIRLYHYNKIFLRRALRWNSNLTINKKLNIGHLNLENNSEHWELVEDIARKDTIDRSKLLERYISNSDHNELDSDSFSRFDPKTLKGHTPRDSVHLNPDVAKVIQNNILSLQIPANIRRSASNYFVYLHKHSVHKPTSTKMEVDAHIAALFLHNYTSIYQALAELKKRIGTENFKPQRILEVGYGPAAGIIAFNDIMGPGYRPEKKDAVILGHLDMLRKAKLILSRQYNEIPNELLVPNTKIKYDEAVVEQETDNENLNELNNEPDVIQSSSESDDLIGEVMIKKIKIVTNLNSKIPASGSYDLIILTHQLLRDEERFPAQVDQLTTHYLSLLSPGGHLIIIERGNPTGFEIIERARQIMLRPENYPEEEGKIPRPWLRGSSVKSTTSSKYKDTELEFFEDFEVYDSKDLDKQISMSDLEESNNNICKDEIANETTNEATKDEVDYHIKVIAPCQHHSKSPLQIGNPKYYTTKEGKNLKIITFQKTVQRPKFTMELKKGKILATKWAMPLDGIGMDNIAQPGTGRPNGRNYENVNYSYLIIQRSLNDKETIKQINEDRENGRPSKSNEEDTWPRIIGPPMKSKGFVSLQVCTPLGKIEKWIIPKSYSKIAYHDARKAIKGDLWALGAKTKIPGIGGINVEKLEKAWKQELKLKKKEAKRKDYKISEMKQSFDDDSSIPDSSASTEDRITYLDNNIKKMAKVYEHEFYQANRKKDKKYKKSRPLI